MRCFWRWWGMIGLAGLLPWAAWAEEFVMLNGDRLKGEPASITEMGLVVKLDIGDLSPKVPWAKFTQETLKKLLQDPRAKPHVEPFIEIPPAAKVKRVPPRPLPVKPVPRVERPQEATGLLASLFTPFGLVMLALLYGCNLFAAFEIALFRRRPTPLVCGFSAVLPIVGPLLFLSLPTATGSHEAPALDPDGGAPEVGGPLPTGAEAAGSSLSVAKSAQAEAPSLQPAVYKRGEFTLNRRFFETKFPGYFRIVLGEAEKNMVLAVKVGRHEHVAKRISRITASDVHLILQKSGNEITVNLAEIEEVELRHAE